MSDTIFLKVTSAFLVGGEVAKIGEIVEVTQAEAKDLLARGKAEVATANDAGGSSVKHSQGTETVEQAEPVAEEAEPVAKKGKK